MHEPEVIQFQAPESHLGFSRHCFDDPKLDSIFHNLIDEHPFNTKVNVVFPSETYHARLDNVFEEDNDFYELEKIPLFEFCTPVFLEAFLNAGKFYAVSCDARLDLDNVAALTPDGCLVLILDKDTYSNLRLNGKLSAHILRRPKERYIVKVNLKNNFIPGRPYYKKVMDAFSEVLLKFNFWISWIPNDSDVCPSSVAKYFSDRGYVVYRQEVQIRNSTLNDLDVPLIQIEINEGGDEKLEIEPEVLLEWIGCTSLGIKLGTCGTSYSDLANPKTTRRIESIETFQCNGFFLPSYIHLLVKELRLILEETEEESLPWVSITVYGHVDSPISWGLTENFYYTNGDNFYTLIIMRTSLLIYKTSGPRKPLRMFSKCNNNK
ncbi:ribonuclease P protein subunit p40-like isoform X1 [Palaemon carinicauda]|uniref:ribonuclease P protein subunit p40-like isoform X1 n=1 Tax=Palaemon carinicauda TaxID=392227 RepID=UPI0035B5CE05